MIQPYDELVTELQRAKAELCQERDAASAREIALAELLAVIKASPGKLAPVFDTMLEKAAQLCGVTFGAVILFDNEVYRAVATCHVPEALTALMCEPRLVEPDTPLAHIRRGETLVHIVDVTAEGSIDGCDLRNAGLEINGARSCLWLALRDEDKVLGCLVACRQEARPFLQLEIALMEHFASHTVLAIGYARLHDELRQRTDELALRNDEYGERIQQQAATIDVLRVMASSPGDPNPAFALMTRRARELCNCQSVGIFEYDGSLVHMRTYEGDIPADRIAAYQAMFPMAPDRKSIACRTILDGRTIHVRDVQAEPDLFPIVRQLNIRTILSMPLVIAGRVVGSFNLNSSVVDGFSDSQIELMRTFGDRAVQRSIHDAHGEDCTDAAEGDAMPTI
jgi:GAF domain-containing protein